MGIVLTIKNSPMNELEHMILNEKLKEKPNYDYIRWLQQLSLDCLKEIGKPFPKYSNNNFVIPK
tara:strand:- start:14219 stop:14410 length:192 start_codon:yes stop_codon:yes gene_type:complete